MVVIDPTNKTPSPLVTATNNSQEELPPSYNVAVGASSSSSAGPSVVAVTTTDSSSPRQSQSSLSYPVEKRSPYLDTPGAGPSSSASGSRSPTSTTPTIYPATWLGHLVGTPQAKADQEVRQTVLGLLQGIIKQGDSTSALPIIQSCYDACRARGLSFESIVQEPSIQGHTPLYWTIVKGVYSSPNASGPSNTSLSGLFDILVSFPLTPTTYSDALQACLLTSSHETFMRLRTHDPAPVMRMPGDDEAIASEALLDSVTVTNGEDTEAALNGAFKVEMNIKDFQKRMRLFKHVPIEFIARGRMWAMTFIVSHSKKHNRHQRSREYKPGAWILALDLIEKSPPTWLDSRVIIGAAPQSESPSPSSSTQPATPGGLARITSTGALRSMLSGASTDRELQPIVFRMRSTGTEQMQGDGGRRPRGWLPQRGEVSVNLSDHVSGNSLEFDGCPYILPDGSLNLVLEAKLVKPKENNPDCVFM